MVVAKEILELSAGSSSYVKPFMAFATAYVVVYPLTYQFFAMTRVVAIAKQDQWRPLCACGCGQKVTLNWHTGKPNEFLWHHSSKVMTETTRRRIGRANKKANTGYVMPQELRHRRSETMKKRAKDPTWRKRRSEVSKAAWQNSEYRAEQV